MIQRAVVVTGGASGIGLSAAGTLKSMGYAPILVGRNRERLKSASVALQHCPVFPCDVSSPENTSAAVREILDHALKSGFDIVGLINNAGIIERKSFLDTTELNWENMWQTNMMGPVRMAAGLLPALRKVSGQIINISSTLGLRPIAHTSAYSATKAAMVNWTKTLALEEAQYGVRVNCICPGLVDTPIHAFHDPKTPEDAILRKQMDPIQPLGRMGEPKDVGQIVGALMQSSWITGSIYTVDGGIIL